MSNPCSEVTTSELSLCVVSSVVCLLSERNRFQRAAHVHQVLLQSRQNCYRNLLDVKTCFQIGNEECHSNI